MRSPDSQLLGSDLWPFRGNSLNAVVASVGDNFPLRIAFFNGSPQCRWDLNDP
jgi:hypothetical protein